MRDARAARLAALEFNFPPLPPALPTLKFTPITVEPITEPRGLSLVCETRRLSPSVSKLLSPSPYPLSDLLIDVSEPGQYIVQGFVTVELDDDDGLHYEILNGNIDGCAQVATATHIGSGIVTVRVVVHLMDGVVRPWVRTEHRTGTLTGGDLTVARVR